MPRYPKGSDEAKEHMAKLRQLAKEKRLAIANENLEIEKEKKIEEVVINKEPEPEPEQEPEQEPKPEPEQIKASKTNKVVKRKPIKKVEDKPIVIKAP